MALVRNAPKWAVRGFPRLGGDSVGMVEWTHQREWSSQFLRGVKRASSLDPMFGIRWDRDPPLGNQYPLVQALLDSVNGNRRKRTLQVGSLFRVVSSLDPLPGSYAWRDGTEGPIWNFHRD